MIVVRTHIAEFGGEHCCFCRRGLPLIRVNGVPRRPYIGQRVGVISGLRFTGDSAYFIGEHDSNARCDLPVDRQEVRP